jgi:uncharacterized membrane-anchored protein
VESIVTAKAEWFYWVTILFSQTLGTALGDWVAGEDRGGLGVGYEYGAMIFGAGLLVVAALYFWSRVSRTALFWAAFILTRPLGATLGDLLDKPVAEGGLHVSRLYASVILLVFCRSAPRDVRPLYNDASMRGELERLMAIHSDGSERYSTSLSSVSAI